jgi:hypothetical protein
MAWIFDALRTDEDGVFGLLTEACKRPDDGRSDFLAQMDRLIVADMQRDMSAPAICASVEQQEIERAWLGGNRRVLGVFPQVARAKIRHMTSEVPQKFVGKVLAVRALCHRIQNGRIGVVGLIVGDLPEPRGDIGNDRGHGTIPQLLRGGFEPWIGSPESRSLTA